MKIDKALGWALAVLLTVGLAGFVGRSYSRSLEALQQQVQAQEGRAVIGPIPVTNGVCHMFFPANGVDRAALYLLCPTCPGRVAALQQRYTVTLHGGGTQCARYGDNALLFSPK